MLEACVPKPVHLESIVRITKYDHEATAEAWSYAARTRLWQRKLEVGDSPLDQQCKPPRTMGSDLREIVNVGLPSVTPKVTDNRVMLVFHWKSRCERLSHPSRVCFWLSHTVLQ